MLVVLTAGLLLVPGNAEAHTRRFSTGGAILVHYVNETVSGTVTSPKGKCVVDRLVTVTVNGAFYGQDITDTDGNWVVAGSDIEPSDDIVGTVSKKFLKKNATHRHLCRRLVL
jgi:hypothetical protein